MTRALLWLLAVIASACKTQTPRRTDVAPETRHESRSSEVAHEQIAAASLAGTEPDGSLEVTVSRDTIRCFDYYLTALGETDLAGVRSLVAAEATRQAPDRSADVLALFDRYTRYLEDLEKVHASTLDSYVAQTLAVQERHFGADAEALFGEDNALAARLVASAAPQP